jgi:LacI family transcriptional regulator
MAAPDRASRPVTLDDVARAARLGRATVSYALRNSSKIPEATRAKIRRIAERIGYRSSPLVAGLMAQVRTGRAPRDVTVLAWLNGHKTRDHWQRVPWARDYWLGASERAQMLGFKLESFWLREPGMSTARISQILTTRGISGVIVPPQLASRAHFHLGWSHFAGACIGPGVYRPALHRVRIHDHHAVLQALRWAWKLGYRRIGLSVPRIIDKAAEQAYSMRYALFVSTLPPRLRVPLHMPHVAGEAYGGTFGEWFRRHRPEVVICHDYRAREWLSACGARVPIDAGLIHLALTDDVAGWSGIDPNERGIGAAAVELVASQLYNNERGVPAAPREIYIRGRWREGQTTRRVVPSTPLGPRTITLAKI